jgi:hypothetical protein
MKPFSLVRLSLIAEPNDTNPGHWDVWLRTRKQCLAAFTVLLMLALGIIIDRHDYDESHLHVDSELIWATNGVNSSSRGIQVDSGASNAKTGTDSLRLLATLGKGINVVTSYDAGVDAGTRPVACVPEQAGNQDSPETIWA